MTKAAAGVCGAAPAAVRTRAAPAGVGFDVPEGHVGPLHVSGRTVWWTGRVAIGLRYEPPAGRHAGAAGSGTHG